MTVKTIYRKPSETLLGSLETLSRWMPLLRALKSPPLDALACFTVIGSLFKKREGGPFSTSLGVGTFGICMNWFFKVTQLEFLGSIPPHFERLTAQH